MKLTKFDKAAIVVISITNLINIPLVSAKQTPLVGPYIICGAIYAHIFIKKFSKKVSKKDYVK